MQRLVGLENRQPNRIQHSVSGPDGLERQTLKEVVVPQLRHRGLPHAPLAQSGYDQGSPGLRLKPMSVGQPPSMAVGTKHDSLALSVWASAQQSPQGRMI